MLRAFSTRLTDVWRERRPTDPNHPECDRSGPSALPKRTAAPRLEQNTRRLFRAPGGNWRSIADLRRSARLSRLRESEGLKESSIPWLFNRHALGEITRLIDVTAAPYGDVIGQ